MSKKQELADKIWGDTATTQEVQEYTTLCAEEKLVHAEEAKEASRSSRNNRQRGRYGERRLAGKVCGVVVGRSKVVKLPVGVTTESSEKYIQIDIKHPPDVVDGRFAYESKWLKEAPAMIRKVMAQAVRNAPQGLMPVGVIGDRESREVFYILTERDFLELTNRRGG